MRSAEEVYHQMATFAEATFACSPFERERVVQAASGLVVAMFEVAAQMAALRELLESRKEGLNA